MSCFYAPVATSGRTMEQTFWAWTRGTSPTAVAADCPKRRTVLTWNRAQLRRRLLHGSRRARAMSQRASPLADPGPRSHLCPPLAVSWPLRAGPHDHRRHGWHGSQLRRRPALGRARILIGSNFLNRLGSPTRPPAGIKRAAGHTPQKR